MSRTRFATMLGLLGLIGLLAFAAWQVSYAISLAGLDGRLGEELGLVHRSVRSEIERFRTLPGVLAQDQRITDLLDEPNSAHVVAANHYLASVKTRTGSAELFLLDARGLTLAASNWNDPLSFVGQNYGFRPYFKDAITKGEGRFYAVGVTTGIPGYFLSSRVETPAGREGVVVVKVDFSPLESTWRQADSLTALADRDGVIFLSGPKGWKYRPLQPLSPGALAGIADERKYDGIALAEAEPVLPDGAEMGMRSGQVVNGLLFKSDALELDGWQIVGARALSPVRTFAGIVAALTALSAMLLSSLALFLRQRRQLVKFRLEQNRVLEERVAVRTKELAHEVEERRRAEHELREAQDELVQAAKLAALGQMSAAIVHEISQPLAAMETTLAAAGAHANRGAHEQVWAKISGARNLTKRIRRTIRHLRSFARKDEGQLVALNPIASIEAALELAAPRARAVGVDVTFDGGDVGMRVMANAVRLEQVLLNLVLNALDAVEGLAAGAVSVSLFERDGQIAMRVTDNGVGIAQEHSSRITEPFFTTKSGSEGMGLGLSISQTIIADFGGTLEFDDNPIGGTVATVRLPIVGKQNPVRDREAAQ